MDDAHVHHLELNRAKEWIKILDEVADGKNPYVAGISAQSKATDRSSAYEAMCNAAEKVRGKDLKAKEHFQNAGHVHEYRANDNELCAESHNNGSVLPRRHSDTAGDELRFVLYSEEASFVIPELSYMASMLIEATELMHKRFSSEAIQLDELSDQLRAFDAQGPGLVAATSA